MMIDNRAAISVIICAYTEVRWADLLEAVASIQNQTCPAQELIVVIDHNPNLLKRARANLVDVNVIPNSNRPGLSGARNSGITVATGTIIAFMDEDAVATPNWLAHLRESYIDSRVMGAGGFIEPLWSSQPPGWFPAEFNWVVGCTYRGFPKQAAQIRNLIGCNMSFRREAIQAVGGFHEDVGQVGAGMLRCDDTEFCIRLRQALPNKILYYNPQAKVLHRVPETRAGWPYFSKRCFTEGIAKSLIARLVGSSQGLSTERNYTLKVLPRGIKQGLRLTLQQHNSAGLLRAGAIVAGFSLAAAGYCIGTFRHRSALKG